MTTCELCNNDSNIIYATKEGLICNICYWQKHNSDEEKSKEDDLKQKMYKRYGL